MLRKACFFFFFQAEAGIRDVAVTGVQTCALPIWMDLTASGNTMILLAFSGDGGASWSAPAAVGHQVEIGRASCRERVEIGVVDVAADKKRRRRTWPSCFRL